MRRMPALAKWNPVESPHHWEPNLSNYLVNCALALVIAFCFWTCDGIADEPKNADYAALNTATLEGKEPRMLLDLSACHVHDTNAAGPSIKASVRFDGYMIQSDGTIAFRDDISHRKAGQIG
jgi:VirK protein